MKKPNDTMHGPYETKKAADIRSSGAVRHAQKSSIQHLTAIVEDRNPDAVMEKLFHVTARGTTWQNECLCGLIQFVSCMYVLPVVPIQLSAAGFETTATINATVSIRMLPNYRNEHVSYLLVNHRLFSVASVVSLPDSSPICRLLLLLQLQCPYSTPSLFSRIISKLIWEAAVLLYVVCS